jgi:hypothetical protein
VYLYRYTACDGTTTADWTKTYTVQKIIPVITLTGNSTVEICQNQTYTDPGASAMSNCNGDITSSIVTNNPVNTSIAGTYTITYNVMDNCGSPAVQVTRTVIVRALPVVAAGAYSPVCVDAPDIILGGTPTGGIWTGTGISGNQLNGYIFDPSTGTQTLTYAYTDGNGCVNSAQTTVTVDQNCNTRFSIKVMLQGALSGSASPALMRDDLRTGGFIPVVEPYTALGGRLGQVNGNSQASIGAGVLAVTGSNAIVDWVLVEFRSASNPAVIVATQAALLQRDGDIVSAADGVSPLSFGQIGLGSQSYYVAVKHRNHLGVMTAAPVSLSGVGTVVDFTTASESAVFNLPGYAGAEMVTVSGLRALWAGDANRNGMVKYLGSNNDPEAILATVLSYPGSGSLQNFDDARGYLSGDINMDGKAKYAGSPPVDTDFIFLNVMGYPLNISYLFDYSLMVEQIPN